MIKYKLKYLILYCFCMVLSGNTLGQFKMLDQKRMDKPIGKAIYQNSKLITISGNQTGRVIQVSGVDKGTLDESETLSQISNDFIYTVKKGPDCYSGAGDLEIIKYSINGDINRVSSLKYPCYETRIVHFDDGSFFILDEGEAGGYELKFYSKELTYVNSYIPYEEGFSNSTFSVRGNTVLFAFNPSDKNHTSQVVLIKNTGDVIFESGIRTSGIILKVLNSVNRHAVYSFSVKSNQHNIHLLNDQGYEQWSKQVSNQVNKWIVNSSERLIIGDRNKLSFYDLFGAEQIKSITYEDIYASQNIQHQRKDKYVELVDIKNLSDGTVGFLLSEPVGMNSFKNSMLSIYSNIDFRPIDNLKLNDSNAKPSLEANDNQFLVINDQNLIYYGKE